MENQQRRKIQLLPDHLANKIAAGEVIQRPESVVKELVENALDAGATRVTINVKDGGTTFIQVSDNGMGMDQDDAVASFLRHATSKISSIEELETIRTYGFRGEALASIASVAQVSLKTRTDDDDAAVMVRIDGGSGPRVTREARERGTTVTVQNLFFNVPARKKFLKSDSTEFRHLFESVQHAALSRVDVEFHLVHNDDEVLSLIPGTIEKRLVDLFGDRLMESVLHVEEKTEAISMWGYIGKPTFGQKTRAHQYLFLNGRYIVHRNISHAVFSSYEHLLTKGTFPFFVLFIEIDPQKIDVNVHPSKLEAKFDDEHAVYRLAAALTRKGLSEAFAVPGLTIIPGGEEAGLAFTPGQHHHQPFGGEDWRMLASVDTSTGELFFPRATGSAPSTLDRMYGGSAAPGAASSPQTVSLQHDGERPESTASGLIWQLHNKYILCQIRSGVMIVDQHVAHERVLYEKVNERFASGLQTAQQLLFPYTLTLNAGDYALIAELLPHFSLLGFEIKLFGKNTIVIEGVPSDVKAGTEDRIVQEILGLYKEYQQKGISDARDALAKSYSCKTAIKAGDPLSEMEMRSLIDQLFATSMPYVCPHGRPVVLRISTEELDRRFGRL